MAALKRKAIISFEFVVTEQEAQELKSFLDANVSGDEGGYIEELHSELEKALAPRQKPGRKSNPGETAAAATEEAPTEDQKAEEVNKEASEAPPAPPAPKERVVRDRNGNVVEGGSKRVSIPVPTPA